VDAPAANTQCAVAVASEVVCYKLLPTLPTRLAHPTITAHTEVREPAIRKGFSSLVRSDSQPARRVPYIKYKKLNCQVQLTTRSINDEITGTMDVYHWFQYQQPAPPRLGDIPALALLD